MKSVRLTSDAVSYLVEQLGMEVEEKECEGLQLLTFTDDEGKVYKTYDEIAGLLCRCEEFTGCIAVDPYSVTIGNELVY